MQINMKFMCRVNNRKKRRKRCLNVLCQPKFNYERIKVAGEAAGIGEKMEIIMFQTNDLIYL